VQLKITHDTWAEAQNEVRELFPGMHLVGWYHSHPHIGVFMSGSDVVIHQDIFNEPWHVALVLDPSRQEAQFYAWQKQQLTGVGGYQIAYPGELLPQGKWKLPEPLTARLRQGPRSLSQFYQVGCWHTRWAKPDDIIIRVQPGAVRTLQESAVQGSEWVVGILFGRLDVSSATWPRYYIDVIDALVSGVDGIANIEKAASAVTSILHKLFEIVRRGQTATVVGMFFCGNSTRIDPERLFRDVFTVLFNNPWDILIMGDTKHGPEYCLWADLGNNLIIRPLIEWVALAEITDNDQETILARVQSAMAGKDFLLQEE
jgi:hypothetical protein